MSEVTGTEETTLSTAAELKQINADKAALSARQKLLRDKQNESKEERKALNKTKAECRKTTQAQKASLRALLADHYDTLSKGEPHEIEMAATEIARVSAELVESTNEFAAASQALSVL